MRIEIKNRFTHQVIFEGDMDGLKGADLSGANLHETDLSGVNLRKTNLHGADLHGADLREAILHGADLHGTDLHGANLRGAILREAILYGANLHGANLRGTDLRGALLREANLHGTDLCEANLHGTLLPSPTMMLLALWGSVSESLTADLMEYDAAAHPDREAFNKWAKSGPCPYADVKVQRAANFQENKTAWGTGKLRGAYSLMLDLFKEKNIKF